jgi:hypothetical protein
MHYTAVSKELIRSTEALFRTIDNDFQRDNIRSIQSDSVVEFSITFERRHSCEAFKEQIIHVRFVAADAPILLGRTMQ